METIEQLNRQFGRLGARLKVSDERFRQRWRQPSGNIVLDIERDRRGEYFEINVDPNKRVEIEALDVQPKERHLLLLVRENDEKHKFLCGHDERHWFVAAIPEAAGGVSTVKTAKEALKPADVKAMQVRLKVRSTDRNRRKNKAFVRQGEWFFVAAPDVRVAESLIIRNEPLSRGLASKPHHAELCYRTGGETVYVCRRYPAGLLEPEYKALLSRKTSARNWGWNVHRRDSAVYVKGKIRHSDHKTITLRCWHRVFMNTENQAAAMRHVAFID